MQGASRSQAGFSMIELMIVVLIVGIIAAVAYPSYVETVVRSKRSAAQACLANYATFMERFYTTNMRYDQDAAGEDIELPDLDCASAQNTGQDYAYSLAAVAATTYTLQSVPIDGQATRDTHCGTLTTTNTGSKGASGSAGATGCW